MPRQHITLLLLLMACAVLVVGQLYVTIPLVADIVGRFSVPASSAALAGTAFGLAYAVGFLVFGPLSDRYGRQRVILLGLIGTAVSTLLVSLAWNFNILLVSRVLQGFAAASFPPTALALVAETLPLERRPLGVSLMSLAFLGAAPLAQVFAAHSAALGLPSIMLVIAPLYLLGALGLFGVLKTSATSPFSIPMPADLANVSNMSLWRSGALLGAWGAAATVLFAFVSFHAGLQTLGQGQGFNLQWLRLVGLPPLLATFAAAPLARRFGTVATARMGLALAAAGLLVGLAGSIPALMSASALLSAGVAIAVPGLIGTVAARAPATRRGQALAVYSFTLFLGASVAPPVAQALSAHGLDYLLTAPAAVLVLAAFLVGGARPRPVVPAT